MVILFTQTFAVFPISLFNKFDDWYNEIFLLFMLTQVLSAFGFRENNYSVVPFGSGLINDTWLVDDKEHRYILQRINEHVFSHPRTIAGNIDRISNYIRENAPDYFFVQPVKTGSGDSLLENADGCFRLSPFVEGSHTMNVVNTAWEAFEAAAQFGKFTRVLRNFDPGLLQVTITDFHNLGLRYKQFTQSVEEAAKERKQKAAGLIDFLQSQENIVAEWHRITTSPGFRQRVTHHDTKISNVLFDRNGKGICVIDLDTVMPGYFISDVGDMMRTYLSPVNEEEKDTDRIEVREDYFLAIVKGYLSEMKQELSETEKNHFVYAGKCMIYMQALRFLADYLQNDTYYGQYYEGHNLVRARNQATLLQKLLDKEPLLQEKALELSQLITAFT